MDLDTTIRNILSRALSQFGVARIPFFFGSIKSTGLSAIPSALDLNNSMLTPDIAPTYSYAALSKFLRLMVNPNELIIKPYVRITEGKTGGGRIYYHWLDESGRAVEAYTLNLKGETGNLLPDAPSSKLRLYYFMKLRELTLEPYYVTTPTGNTLASGAQELKRIRNQQFIIARTIGLPAPILFSGFYRQPITHRETAKDQYNIQWDCEFVIEEMFPRYEDISALAGATAIIPEIVSALGLDI